MPLVAGSADRPAERAARSARRRAPDRREEGSRRSRSRERSRRRTRSGGRQRRRPAPAAAGAVTDGANNVHAAAPPHQPPLLQQQRRIRRDAGDAPARVPPGRRARPAHALLVDGQLRQRVDRRAELAARARRDPGERASCTRSTRPGAAQAPSAGDPARQRDRPMSLPASPRASRALARKTAAATPRGPSQAPPRRWSGGAWARPHPRGANRPPCARRRRRHPTRLHPLDCPSPTWNRTANRPRDRSNGQRRPF